jgi:hypothetical protein
MDHVAIDRITCFASDGKKFDACALESPVFKVTLAVRFTKEEPKHLFWFAALIRDLREGHLAVGGATTRGYGAIASAEIVELKADLASDQQDLADGLHTQVTEWHERKRYELRPEWTALRSFADKGRLEGAAE